jgi:hypothetical protein
MATKKKNSKTEIASDNSWPKITQGSHLTVIEHENGRRELHWNDAALIQDVRNAIDNYEQSQMKPNVRAKTVRKKK